MSCTSTGGTAENNSNGPMDTPFDYDPTVQRLRGEIFSINKAFEYGFVSEDEKDYYRDKRRRLRQELRDYTRRYVRGIKAALRCRYEY